MYILGVSAYYHDSAATLIKDGQIVAAAQEERFSRKKHDPGFPRQAVEFCLSYAGIELEEVDMVVFYDKPFLKFERLLETYYNYAPSGLISFLKAMPVWLKEKLLLRKVLDDEFSNIGTLEKDRLFFSEHHLSHGASAFYPSPFEEAAIVTVDGVGEWATASISKGQGSQIEVKRELHFPHSLGLLYSSFTYFLGFRVNSGEYKLMGLAPYGDPVSEETKRFVDIIKKELVDIKDDGSIGLDMNYFSYPTGDRMVKDTVWEKLFGFPRREGESEILQHHCNLAFAIQEVTEEIMLKLATTARELTGSQNLVLAGGVALNCVANGKILTSGIFDKVWIQPAAGDAGGALGAALAGYYIYQNNERQVDLGQDQMKGSYFGPEYSSLDIQKLIRKYAAQAIEFDSLDDVVEKTSTYLSEEKVIGWFQGRMEFGPRALGNRSILGDARNPEMQKRLNLKIKYREGFRPFAPSVLNEETRDFFDLDCRSPYMLLVAEVIESRRKALPQSYEYLTLREKLKQQR
ncbi:MAG: hypothetical protein HRT44_07090, partial [Bdellovibrionales bacterium]|nr:hypothetical protein [Bdellovibrionales bacterium]NQZ19002.1 hypothetical protein [Bdellovibrionales bacterium]